MVDLIQDIQLGAFATLGNATVQFHSALPSLCNIGNHMFGEVHLDVEMVGNIALHFGGSLKELTQDWGVGIAR